jgi:hypothetical protein
MTEPNVVPVEIYPGQDFYVPSFSVAVRGQELHILEDVLSVNYTDSLTAIDSFDMTVNNWDQPIHGPGRFKYSDANTLDPFQDVVLTMGYYLNGNDHRRQMLVGEIVTMTPNFPSGGASTLTIRALNILHRFRMQPKTEVYLRKKDSEIAQLIVDDIARDVRRAMPGVTVTLDQQEKAANIPHEPELPYVVMHNQYPIEFLFLRSKRNGYALSAVESGTGSQRNVTIHYRRPNQVVDSTYRLEWGKTLISFSPSLQTANQVSEVTVKWWDPQTKQEKQATANRSRLPAEGLVSPIDLNVTEGPLAQKLEIVSDRVIQNQEEGEQVALRILRQLAQGLVEGRGRTIGLPDLRAGCKVDIIGLGSRFEGTYVVTATTHSLGDGGYTTDFTARMEQRLRGGSR